jgi:5-methylcytosine-specific restriction protein A
MSNREFRAPASYVSEGITRAMVPSFLLQRGFTDIKDSRKLHGRNESQTIDATAPDGRRLSMRVRLGWYRAGRSSRGSYSAVQLVSSVKSDDWVGTLQEKVKREQSVGITHFLFVQREAETIVYAALVPAEELLSIWLDQRDISISLIKRGELGRRKTSHAMNGSSPTLWLQEDRAPEVVRALWEHQGVQDLAALEAVTDVGNFDLDDTFGDILQFGSDGAPRLPIVRSGLKRDRRVRAVVLQRAQGRCERRGCGDGRDYAGFLDVHHVLGVETSDRAWNCVAVCPNCHREAHVAPDLDEINIELLAVARRYMPDPGKPSTSLQTGRRSPNRGHQADG